MYSNLAGILLNSVPILPSSTSLPELGRVLRIPAGLWPVLQELEGDSKVLLNRCTNTGIEQLSISKCHTIEAGLKFVTNKLGHDPGVLCKLLHINLEQGCVRTELTHFESYLMWDKKSYILQATTADGYVTTTS